MQCSSLLHEHMQPDQVKAERPCSFSFTASKLLRDSMSSFFFVSKIPRNIESILSNTLNAPHAHHTIHPPKSPSKAHLALGPFSQWILLHLRFFPHAPIPFPHPSLSPDIFFLYQSVLRTLRTPIALHIPHCTYHSLHCTWNETEDARHMSSQVAPDSVKARKGMRLRKRTTGP